MGFCNLANLKKAFFYFQKNGIRKTGYAIRERLEQRKQLPYVYVPLSEQQLEEQRGKAKELFPMGEEPLFSILVPAYRTGRDFLFELLDSLADQSYPHWELILADASPDATVEDGLSLWQQDREKDERIRYIRLAENGGISANTNEALKYATGAYVGLLDHDDVLTSDALFEMASAISRAEGEGIHPRMLYSDEDKCNGDRSTYYEPHLKEDINLDLLFSNNYICHFLVMERQLMGELKLRKEYDGVQDYDLVLRAVDRIWPKKEQILHIPKVLYHWRCHVGSTAENPRSKLWAYEAGCRALQAMADARGYGARVEHTEHVGFYRLQYGKDFWEKRCDVGALGGSVWQKGRLTGGRYTRQGEVLYKGLSKGYSGYMHRAAMAQDAWAVDIRCIAVREQLREDFGRIMGVPYQGRMVQDETGNDWEIFDSRVLPPGADYGQLSLAWGKELEQRGYLVIWNPALKIEG
ncbi:MAG: glycosyltransferase [Lachnospiraceae bacterium]|nr:glycosyltransferase [Lachnospiraceae bacterium]